VAVFSGGKFHTYTSRDGLADNRVWYILEDHRSDLWFGSDTGLTRLHNGTFSVIRTESGADTDPLVGSVTYIYEDRAHVLWIGTYGSGLKRLKDGRLTTYKKSNGLFDDSAWNILEDKHGRFWMSSNYGIFRTDKKELNDYAAGKITAIHSVSYGTSDGMPVAECNGGSQNSAWSASDGRFLFACVHGIVALNPEKTEVNSLPPPVAIDQASIDGASHPNHVAMGVGKGQLEFHFAALSFVAPEKNQVRYKLEGFDGNWIDAGNRRDAYYTNIPPGRYRFRVIAANNDGVWNEQGAAFSFELLPRFYQTRWFRLLCCTLVLTLVWLVYVWRVRQLHRREAGLERLVAERTAALEREIAGHRETEVELQQEIAERKRATERAEAATRAKSEFLANMSHEIRTPLNGVLGMLDVVAATELSSDQNELVTMARHSADGLLAVINDILDFSKIEAGKMQFECEPFDLTETIAYACRTMSIKAHAKGLELACCVAPDVPSHLRGDAARLRQVLLNLLGNAVKFTEQGEVVLRVDTKTAGDEEVELKFSVADTGVGIPPDKQQSIFQAFAQADTSVTRRFGGTGLGLTICARIVNLMGGRIWISSEPERGSTFYFTAKFDRVSAPPAENRASRIGPDGLRALIVDDNTGNRQILRDMLAQLGVQAVTAETPHQTLAHIREASR
ncbi:MAG: hypothetical protein JOZ22_07455, partial [Acidobacteriia bacterium]|nr:hypothetical protein [Terriglobia bacterium]